LGLRSFFLLLMLCGISSAADETVLNSALEKHRWFELRDLVLASHSAPLYRFYVAAAFNDAKSAEKELRVVARAGEHKDRLANMYFTLNRLYYRVGNYRKAADAMERCLALAGQDPDPSDKTTLSSLRQLPVLKVVSRRPSVLKYSHPLDWPYRQMHPTSLARLSMWPEAVRIGICREVTSSREVVGDPLVNGRHSPVNRRRLSRTKRQERLSEAAAATVSRPCAGPAS
jgi:hypothetical protein